MSIKIRPSMNTVSITAGILALSVSAAAAQTIVVATDRQGSLMNRVATAIAKTISDNSKVRAVVRPFAGPDAYMASLNDGRLKLGVFTATSAYIDVRGENKAKRAYKNIRTLRSGANVLRLGFVVPAKSNMKTVADLKGKKFPSDFGGHSALMKSIATGLSTGGLTWDDVKKVPVTGVVDGVKSLQAGRTEAIWGPVGMPAVRQVHAKLGLRFLSFPDTPEALAGMRKLMFPGLQLFKFKKSVPPLSIVGPTNLITYDTYLAVHKDLDPVLAKKILEGLWKGAGQLTKASPILRGFSNKAAATTVPMMPYHKTAVAYYKEKGIWSKDVEAGNAIAVGWVK